MPLTQLQAESNNIINALLYFLNRNVKVPYDIRAAATSTFSEVYTSPLKVMIGKPDDPNIVNNPPVIAIDDVTSTERNRFYEIGTNNLYRHFNFVLCCYPSLNSLGQASLSAQKLLESFMRNAMSAENLKLPDYTNPLFSPTNILYCNDVMQMLSWSGPYPRGANSSLAQQKHRFDIHVSLSVVVSEGNVS
jgi:hypothetical protein